MKNQQGSLKSLKWIFMLPLPKELTSEYSELAPHTAAILCSWYAYKIVSNVSGDTQLRLSFHPTSQMLSLAPNFKKK